MSQDIIIMSSGKLYSGYKARQLAERRNVVSMTQELSSTSAGRKRLRAMSFDDETKKLRKDMFVAVGKDVEKVTYEKDVRYLPIRDGGKPKSNFKRNIKKQSTFRNYTGEKRIASQERFKRLSINNIGRISIKKPKTIKSVSCSNTTFKIKETIITINTSMGVNESN